MTVHDSELLEEIIPLLKHLDDNPGVWVPFSHDRDRDFAAAARWLVHHPDSPAHGIAAGRTLAIQWKTAGGDYVTARTTTDPVRAPGTSARLGRIRYRTPRPDTRKNR